MPIYEFYCDKHDGAFDHLCSIASRNNKRSCPTCGGEASRIITAPNLSIMDVHNREAWSRNEKSAHEPKSGRKHICSSSCNHSHDNKNSSNTQFKMQKKQRPWMLGH